MFKLYPTKAQAAALTETVEMHRRLYNRALAERKTAWETEQRGVTYGEQSAALKTQRAADPSLARANFSSCQRTLKRLDRTFQSFFRRVVAHQAPGYPRFRGAGRFRIVEYTHRDGCRFFDTSLYVQHVGRVKVKQHRPTEGTIKAVGVTRKADGWHCVVVCDPGDVAVAPKEGPVVGIDLGLTAFLVTSDGETVAPPRYARRAQAALRRAQRTVARRKKGSARRRKAVAQLRRQHLHVANQRRDFHHKTALALIRRYGTVCHEALNITDHGHRPLSVGQEHARRRVGTIPEHPRQQGGGRRRRGAGRPARQHVPGVLPLRRDARRVQDSARPRARVSLRLHRRPGPQRGAEHPPARHRKPARIGPSGDKPHVGGVGLRSCRLQATE